MAWVKIKQEKGKSFPIFPSKRENRVPRRDINKLLKQVVRSQFREEDETKIITLLFDRRLDKKKKTYQIGIRETVLKWMFNHGKFPSAALFDGLFSLDKDLLQMSWGDLTVNYAKRQLSQVLGISSLMQLTWSYICTQQGIHFVRCNELICNLHTLDADYLHTEYVIEDSSFHDSFLSKTIHLKSTTETVSKLEQQVKQLQLEVQQEQRKVQEEQKKEALLRGQLEELKKQSQQTKLNIYGANGQWLMREYIKTTEYVEKPADLTQWISREMWYFQSCDHEKNLLCRDQCFKECDEKYQELLTRENEKFIKSHYGTFTTVGIKLGSHTYHINWQTIPKGVRVSQVNIETKKERILLKKSKFDIWSSIKPGHIVKSDDFEKLANIIGHSHLEGPLKHEVWLTTEKNHNVEQLFLFCNSGLGCLGQSMASWALINRSTVAVTQLQLICNPKLVEAFLIQRRNANSSFCLFGFHGTNKTHPHTIASTGLDPRYSSTASSLFLGAATYVSLSAYYCHLGGYSYKLDAETYQLIVVCFLPGRFYHESHPLSAEATSRRVAPTGKDTVTCITNDTRVWALYERYMAYPMYILTYTVKPD
jgi:hypothetical protein